MNFKYLVLLLIFAGTLITSLWPNNIYLLFGFSVLVWIVLPLKMWWDKTTLSLALFSIFFLLIQLFNGHAVESRFVQGTYLLAPVAFYRFGRFLIYKYKLDESRQYILLLILFLYLLPLFIATFKDIALVGIVNETRQLLADISGKKTTLSATLYGLMSSLGIGCISCLLLRNQPIKLKICFISITALSLLAVIHLVNRTGLVLCIACLLVSFMVSTKFKFTKVIPSILLLSFLFFILLSTGIISQDMVDAYTARENNSDFNASSAGGRTDLWLDGIGLLMSNPLGWTYKEGYHHNLWLDLAKISGIVPFLFFCYASLRFLKDWIRTAKYNKSNTALLLLSISVAGLLNAAVEPTIEGSMLFFSMLMLIWGMLKQIALESRKV